MKCTSCLKEGTKVDRLCGYPILTLQSTLSALPPDAMAQAEKGFLCSHCAALGLTKISTNEVLACPLCTQASTLDHLLPGKRVRPCYDCARYLHWTATNGTWDVSKETRPFANCDECGALENSTERFIGADVKAPHSAVAPAANTIVRLCAKCLQTAVEQGVSNFFKRCWSCFSFSNTWVVNGHAFCRGCLEVMADDSKW